MYICLDKTSWLQAEINRKIMDKVTTWKLWLHVLGYFLCFGIGGAIAGLPRIIIGFENEHAYVIILSEIARIVITIFLLVIYTKYVVRIPDINTKLLNYENIKPFKWIMLGLFLPALLIISLITMNALEVIEINFNIQTSILFSGILISIVIALASGILEELVFRGYMLEILHKKYSFWVAGLSPAIIFALIHMGGAGNIFNGLQILFGGVLVSVLFMSIYRVSGKIWNSCIVHGLWNFIILNKLMKIGSTEEISSDKILTLLQSESILLSGGEFGIEVSLNAILIYVFAVIIMLNLNKNINRKPAANKG
jgi:hypothetical protein